MRRAVVILLLLLFAPGVAAEEPCPARRHVDCAGAARAVEAAIVADPWLAILDRARAMRMAELAGLLEPESRAELARQDAAWRRSLSRELSFHPDGTLDEAEPRAALRGRVEHRLALLFRVEHDPAASLAGVWVGVQGRVTVRGDRDRPRRVEIATADVNDLAWLCEYEGVGESPREEWLETADGVVELRREGNMLRVRMLTARPSEHCGASGSLGGLFFRVGAAE